MSLINYLPSHYSNDEFIQNLLVAPNKETELLIYALEDLKNNLYVNTATWGLRYFEEEYGLKVDINKSYEERREAIRAKMRGQGTTTIQMLKDTSMAFTGGQIDVIEQSELYHFIIKFTDIKGIPKNIEDFKSMVRLIKPAHLTYEIQYLYNVWKFFIDKGTKWQDVASLTWEEARMYND